MKPIPPNSKFVQNYHLCFVIALTLLFLSVMFMSSKQQGLGNLEESFFQRNFFIEYFNRLRIKIGDRVFNNVLIGKDQWLEFTGNENLDDYQNVFRFSPETLQSTAQIMQACYRYAQERDMTFLVVVAPNKANIYPDKLPDQIRPLSGISRTDQLNSYLRAHHIPEVLDVRAALRDARQEHDTYYKMGTHWNEYGAYVVYETIIHALSQSHPGLKPYPEKFFRFQNNPPSAISRADRDLANILYARHLSLEPNLFATRDLDGVIHKVDFPIPPLPGTGIIPGYHTIAWIPNSELPSLLLFHDSFGIHGLNDFLALNFSKVHYVYRGSASLFMNRQSIDQFSPDVLVYQITERQLDFLPSELLGCAKD